MSEPKSIPSEINSADAYKFGNLNITGLLKAGEDYVIDGQPIENLSAPISFDSPIRCSSFSAELGTVSFFERAARRDWSPSNASEFLSSWYDPSDASTLNGFTNNAALVTATMADKSGNGNTLTVGGAQFAKLLTNTDALNGLNVLTFSNAVSPGGAYMNSEASNIASSGNISIFLVGKVTGPLLNVQSSLFSVDGATLNVKGSHDFDFVAKQLPYFQGQINSTGLGLANTSRPQLTDVNRNGPSIFSVYTLAEAPAYELGVVIDGSYPEVLSTSNNPDDSYGPPTNILDDSLKFNLFTRRVNHIQTAPEGLCGEVIILNTAKLAVRQTVEGYLAHKWGLEGNLPSDHPYKASSPKV